MEMSGPLAVESAMSGGAVLGSAEALEAFLNDGRVLAMVIGMHLNIGRAYVHLIARILSNGRDAHRRAAFSVLPNKNSSRQRHRLDFLYFY